MRFLFQPQLLAFNWFRLTGWLLAISLLGSLVIAAQVRAATTTTAALPAPSVKVHLVGVNASLRSSLLAGLSIERLSTSPRLNANLVAQLNLTAVQELTHTLNYYGYYNATITADLQLSAPLTWVATYTLELGDPVLITQLNLAVHGPAAQDAAVKTVLANLPLHQGATLRHADYAAAKRDLLRVANARGFFDASFTCNQVEVDPNTNSAQVCLVFSSGPRYKFGQLLLPPAQVNAALLYKMLPFQTGDYYDAALLLAGRNNLIASGYFATSQSLVMLEERQANQVDVQFTLSPNKKHRYTASLGYGTDTGARLGLGWHNRYINRRGHQLGTDLRWSEIATRTSADYLMPYWSQQLDLVGLGVEYNRTSTNTSTTRGYALGPYYQRKRWGWEESGSLKAVGEHFTVAGATDSVFMLVPGVGWSRSWADSSLYTRKGGRLGLTLSGATEELISDVNFVQLVVEGKYIVSLAPKGRLLTRAKAGTTAVSDFALLPVSLRFFAGGDNSIRGFEYESLGPRNAQGAVTGGKNLVVGSLEYEQLFASNWGLAVFSDWGKAFNEWSESLEQGIGLGWRWRSPVGLVRLDLARGISAPAKPWRLHLVIGPDL